MDREVRIELMVESVRLWDGTMLLEPDRAPHMGRLRSVREDC